MHVHDLVQQTLGALGSDWWTFPASSPVTAKSDINYPLAASDVKAACLMIAPDLSELRIHHLVACVLQTQGINAYMVVGRDRSTDIISPAYRSWISVPDVGVVSTADDVEILCDEIIRLPYRKEPPASRR